MLECIHRVKRKSSACAGLITATNTVRPCTAVHNEAVVLGTWSDRDACRCLLCSLHMRGLGVGGVAASLKTAARKGPEPGLACSQQYGAILRVTSLDGIKAIHFLPILLEMFHSEHRIRG